MHGHRPIKLLRVKARHTLFADAGKVLGSVVLPCRGRRCHGDSINQMMRARRIGSLLTPVSGTFKVAISKVTQGSDRQERLLQRVDGT